MISCLRCTWRGAVDNMRHEGCCCNMTLLLPLNSSQIRYCICVFVSLRALLEKTQVSVCGHWSEHDLHTLTQSHSPESCENGSSGLLFVLCKHWSSCLILSSDQCCHLFKMHHCTIMWCNTEMMIHVNTCNEPLNPAEGSAGMRFGMWRREHWV